MDKKTFYQKIAIEPRTTKTVHVIGKETNKRKTIKPNINNQEMNEEIKSVNPDTPSTPKSIKLYKNLGKIEKIFDNETVYLVAGGPSLKGFDFNKLINKNTIAINKAFIYCECDVLYWTDMRFYKWFEKEIKEYKGLKVTNKPNPIAKDIINLRDSGRTGLDTDPRALRHGNNSGYAAINLAYHTGAKNIILLGYDMGQTGTTSHFHDGYNIRHNPKIYQNNMLPHFNTIVEPLREKGVNVWNANPNSNLKCFPFCTIDEALNF